MPTAWRARSRRNLNSQSRRRYGAQAWFLASLIGAATCWDTARIAITFARQLELVARACASPPPTCMTISAPVSRAWPSLRDCESTGLVWRNSGARLFAVSRKSPGDCARSWIPWATSSGRDRPAPRQCGGYSLRRVRQLLSETLEPSGDRMSRMGIELESFVDGRGAAPQCIPDGEGGCVQRGAPCALFARHRDGSGRTGRVPRGGA